MFNSMCEVTELDILNNLKVQIKEAAADLFLNSLQFHDRDNGFEANFDLVGYVDWVEFSANAGEHKLSFDRISIISSSTNDAFAIEQLENNLAWLKIANEQLIIMYRDWLQEANKENTHVST